MTVEAAKAILHSISRWSPSFRLARVYFYTRNPITLNVNVIGNKKSNNSKRGRPTKGKIEKLGIKATQYAREMTLKGGIKSRFTLEELDLMRKLSGIAKKANQAGFSNVAIEVVMIANEIKKLFHNR